MCLSWKLCRSVRMCVWGNQLSQPTGNRTTVDRKSTQQDTIWLTSWRTHATKSSKAIQLHNLVEAARIHFLKMAQDFPLLPQAWAVSCKASHPPWCDLQTDRSGDYSGRSGIGPQEFPDRDILASGARRHLWTFFPSPPVSTKRAVKEVSAQGRSSVTSSGRFPSNSVLMCASQACGSALSPSYGSGTPPLFPCSPGVPLPFPDRKTRTDVVLGPGPPPLRVNWQFRNRTPCILCLEAKLIRGFHQQ